MRVVRRLHPRGEAGTRVSLEETARKAAEGRLDPRTRAWAIEKLVQAGNPKGTMDKASAILTALRRERIYVPDPTDAEFIPSAACTLKGCYGLKFLGEDCDGLLVSFLAAVGSIGIEGAVVGHGYDDEGNLSHVLAAVYDGNRWHLGDPSTSQPFGTVSRAQRERWIAVPSGKTICDTTEGRCDPAQLGSALHGRHMRPYGDFVGVGAPDQVQLAGTEVVIQDVGAPYVMQALSNRAVSLRAQLEDLRYHHTFLRLLRAQYLDKPIAAVQDPTAPESEYSWTVENEQYYEALIPFMERSIRYTDQALAGDRPAGFDPSSKSIVVLGEPGETYLQMHPNGDIQVNQATVQQGPAPGQVGIGTYIALGFAVVVLLSITTLGVTYMVTNTANAYIKASVDTNLVALRNKLVEQGYTPEQADIAVQKVGDTIAKKAAAETKLESEKNKGTESITETINLILYGVMGIALLGAGAYAITAFGPKISEAWEARKARKQLERLEQQEALALGA